ncbi:MAG: (d)CMP kinase [Planctomycetota bacterium]
MRQRAGAQDRLEVVTIDGPAGAGKSTVSRQVAGQLGFRFLNTGLFYRGVAWRAAQMGEGTTAFDWLEGLSLRVDSSVPAPDGAMRDDDPVYIRTAEGEREIPASELKGDGVKARLSQVAADLQVRQFLLPLQRNCAKDGPLVVEGRDTGSVVFPDAAHKFFLVASLERRAERRHSEELERAANGGAKATDVASLLCEIAKRDSIDYSREHAPLRRPEDAVYVDSSDMTRAEVVDHLIRRVKGEGGAA